MPNTKFTKILVDSTIHYGSDADTLSRWLTENGIDPAWIRLDTIEVDPVRRQIRLDAYRHDGDTISRGPDGQPIIERLRWECDPTPVPNLAYTAVVETDDDPS